jgi:hypothetical protein
MLGIEGLALLRAGAGRRFERVEQRVREIEEIAGALEEHPYSARRNLPEYGVDAGYAAWADSYDDPGNDTIALEEPIVRAMLDELPQGRCSTPRAAPAATPPTSPAPVAR